MLVDNARLNSGVLTQYVLITPQDIGQIVQGADVRIHRMRDPERGQTRLNVV